jgi:hypothetical protein
MLEVEDNDLIIVYQVVQVRLANTRIEGGMDWRISCNKSLPNNAVRASSGFLTITMFLCILQKTNLNSFYPSYFTLRGSFWENNELCDVCVCGSVASGVW